MINNIKKFDERQLWLRGNIFKHMFFIMGALLMINAFLAASDIIWADGFISNLIIFVASLVAGSVEMIFKGVYIQGKIQQRIMMMMSLISGLLVFTASTVKLLRNGEKFVSDGALTENGGFFILSVLFLTIGVSAAVKLLRDKSERDREE